MINNSILRLSGAALLSFSLAACTSFTPGSSVEQTAQSVESVESRAARIEAEKQAQTEVAAAAPQRQGIIDQEFCPRLRLRGGTENYRKYAGNNKDDPGAVQYQATILKVARECNYRGNILNMKVGAAGRVISGPKGGPGTFNMPIRVAVRDTSGAEPCTRYFVLHKHQGVVRPGSTGGQFQFIDGNLNVPANRAKDLSVFVGFDEGPYNKSSAKTCAS